MRRNIFLCLFFACIFIFLYKNNITAGSYSSNSYGETRETADLDEVKFRKVKYDVILTMDDRYLYYDIRMNCKSDLFDYLAFRDNKKANFSVNYIITNKSNISSVNYSGMGGPFNYDDTWTIGSEYLYSLKKYAVSGTSGGGWGTERNINNLISGNLHAGAEDLLSEWECEVKVDFETGKEYMDLYIHRKIKMLKITVYKYQDLYIMFYFKNCLSTSSSRGGYMSGCTVDIINLRNEVDTHTHDLQMRVIDDKTHENYCEACGLSNIEDHEFIYPYDDIENNMCECGYKKYVKINIDDSFGNSLYDNKLIPGDNMIDISYDKLGYNFLYVKENKILYDDEGNKKNYVSYISNVPDTCPNYSCTYTIIYEPHKYFIIYNKNNNYNIDLDRFMANQTVKYGEKVKLSKNLYNKKGYSFLGWAMMPDLNTPIYEDQEEIFNITNEDNYEVNLYPVFDPMTYKVEYGKGDGSGYMPPEYYTVGIEEEISKYGYSLDDEYKFQYWQYRNVRIDGDTSKSLDKYVQNDGEIIHLDPVIKYIERKEKNESSGGGGSTIISGNGPSGTIGGIGPGFTGIDENFIGPLLNNMYLDNINTEDNKLEILENIDGIDENELNVDDSNKNTDGEKVNADDENIENEEKNKRNESKENTYLLENDLEHEENDVKMIFDISTASYINRTKGGDIEKIDENISGNGDLISAGFLLFTKILGKMMICMILSFGAFFSIFMGFKGFKRWGERNIKI